MYCLRCGETSLLAAANPKDSRFNETEKEYKQIEMSSASYDSCTGELDVDIIEGTSKKDRDLRTQVRLVLENRDGKATTSEIAEALEWDESEAEHKLEKLSNSRIIYSPAGDSQDTWRMV